MMDAGVVAFVKYIASIVAVPVIGLFGWLGKRLYSRVDMLESRMNDIDKKQAVQQSQLADIKQDIQGIDRKLDKIIDRLTQ